MVAELVVATDDQRVVEAVAPIGITGILTNGAHCSGTDRAAEILSRPEYEHIDVVLNVQGDQPFIPERAVSGALEMVRTGFPIGTAAARLASECLEDGSKVKVWVDATGRAHRFSRHATELGDASALAVYHHIGVYAYTREALLNWVRLPATSSERELRLEQLRPLEHGTPIGVRVLDQPAPHSIDTPEDLRRAGALSNELQVTI